MIEVRLKKIGNVKIDREALFIAGDIIYPGDKYIVFSDSALAILEANSRIEIKGKEVKQVQNDNKDKFEGTFEEFAILHFKTVEKYLPGMDDLEFLESAQKLAKGATADRIANRLNELLNK